MKYKIVCLGLVVIFATACKKGFLDRVPQNQLPEVSFWKNESDLKSALNGVYANLEGDGIIYKDAASEIAYSQNPWESFVTVAASGTVISTLDAGWDFGGIRRANLLLEHVKDIPMDEATKKVYVAETLFLRAYFYQNLMNYFGAVPIITKTLEVNKAFVPRSPKAAVLKFILDDLKAAAKDLPTVAADKGRVTKGAALAMISRIYLNENDWQNASNYAKQVMDLNIYTLFKVKDESDVDKKDDYKKWVDFADAADESKFRLGLRSYQYLFTAKNKNNTEVIFDRQQLKLKEGQYINTLFMPNELGGWGSIMPTQDLIDSYESYKTGNAITPLDPMLRKQRYTDRKTNPIFYDEYKNRDPRFYASINFPGASWQAVYPSDAAFVYDWSINTNSASKTGYNFRKMVDLDAYIEQIDNYSNVILIRYPEVLLSYAEAMNELSGPSPAVYNALDLIRNRVGMPNTDRSLYGSQATLRTFIRNERKIELAMEGLRYMDIRRWKIAPQVMKTTYDIEHNVAQERTWSEKLYLMPVPQAQIDIDKGLTQNPGY